ncbi:MAG: TIGR02302 family protein [Paracoccaceae bacterium]
MADRDKIRNLTMDRLRWRLALTRAGMVAQRLTRVFWPLMSVVFVVLAVLMFGGFDLLSLEMAWAGMVLAVLAGLVAFGFGVRRFSVPTRRQAMARLDATATGSPIAALHDDQAIGSGDAGSEIVWNAHIQRMAARADALRAVAPDLKIADRDPYALRYVATLAMVMALLFGSVWRVANVADVLDGKAGAGYVGAAWEGWIKPPAYTGKPTVYLADVAGGEFAVPEGSQITLRLYGEVGSLTVAETVSGRVGDIGSAADPNQIFQVMQSGDLSIQGDDGASWSIKVVPDAVPFVELLGDIDRRASGDMHLPFAASDDYGVVSGTAELMLDLGAVDRRFGLVVAPEPRKMIMLDLPMPFTGDGRDIVETLIENLAEHPWAGLPVKVSLFASDGAEQTGASVPETIILPGRRFFDPLAAAIIEQRRDLLWSRENTAQISRVLRAVSHRPEGFIASDTAYLKLRVAIRRLEAGSANLEVPDAVQIETAQVLWDIAVLLEDGNLADAKKRFEQAQERLQQAMRDGASDDEIAKLMDELRDAMQDYMQQLAEQGEQNDDAAENQETQEITSEQLQEMLDRIQELMEQGRMAEAQELMQQLREMMENMQVTQGPGQQSPGQQALNDLSETLREQQGLSDDTFSDLQEQFSEDGQEGEEGEQGQDGQQGQQGEPGQDGQQGQESQGGQQGQQGQQGEGGDQGQGSQQGRGQGSGGGNEPAPGLAQRQQSLRNQLDGQSQNLPGSGGDGTARDALDRAGRAMEGAEQSLQENDFAGALDRQSEALEALREGMRELADQLAQEQNQQDGQQGQASGRAQNETQQDPLGRDASGNGRVGSDENILQGEDVYRRAQELLREIRRRSSEQGRPTLELDYLKRLLDQF